MTRTRQTWRGKDNPRRRVPAFSEKQVKVIDKKINGKLETKSLCTFGTSGFSYTGGFGTGVYINALGNPGQALTGNGRIGNEYNPIKLDVNYTLYCGDVQNICRILVFQWMEDSVLDGPTAIEMFDTTSYTGNVQVHACYNWFARKKYNILYDNYTTLVGASSGAIGTPTASNPATNNTVRPFKVRINAKRLRKAYTTTTAGGDPLGSIYILAISDSAITPNPFITWSMRLLYKDA